jgi:hypothetical protein
MRFLRFLLLAWFILGATAQAMAAVHKCCPSAACSVAQCIDMGCAPPAPAVAFQRPAVAQAISAAPEYVAHATTRIADPYEEVWTPPD